ncbi:MAG: hypothetical protein CL569_15470 [Alphaproteobacteria bacterium]|nr:hypothetical protein [Alphaproteobacteria bacterium]|tara:strand:+ start:352 stop:1236 length:885 start_codon:yes stop_codon:yes gene_type:complete
MPVSALILASAFWASTMIANKSIVDALLLSEIVSGRFAIGALTMWSIALLAGQGRNLKAIGWGPVLLGILDPGIAAVFMVWGLSLSSAVSGTVLLSTQPILMPLLGWLVLRESLSASVVAGAVVALIGAVLLVYGQEDHGGGTPLGDMLLTIGVLVICGAQLIARRIAQVHGRAMAVTSVQLTMAAVVGLIVMVAVDRPANPFSNMDTNVVLTLLYLGVIGSTGPFFLYNYALRYLTVGMVSLLLTLIAPLGALMSWLYLGTEVSLLDWIAIGIVVFGVLLPTIASSPIGRRRI